jgi:predicted anti-sigma-YlaC factor YlaD
MMKTQSEVHIDCKTCHTHLADLLLDDSYGLEHPEFAAHLSNCAECRIEFTDLKATFALLDEWVTPEPTQYFDSKLHARLREAEAAQPEGFWERMRSFVLFSTGRHLRPVMAGVLAVTILAGGGGTFLGIHQHNTTEAVSPTVNDLKILDNNAQALQQMDQLLDDSQSSDDSGPPIT